MIKLYQIATKLIIVIFFYAIQGYSQGKTPESKFEFTKTIESKYLNETRSITIQLPKSYYETQDAKYSMLVVLDGERHKDNTKFIHDFLAGKEHIPESILVFIHDIGQRSRDFYTFNRGTETINNGVNDFLNFIENETIPLVVSEFRTSGYHMLSGHSAAGLFVIHSLLKRPELFKARFAFSASSHHIPKQRELLKEFLTKNKNILGYFYMNVGGSEFYKMQDSHHELKEIFQDHAPEGLRFDFDYHDVDGHQSSPFIGQYMAFKRLNAPCRLKEKDYEIMSYQGVRNHFAKISLEFEHDVKPSERELFSMANYYSNFQPNLLVLDKLLKLAQNYYPDSKDMEGDIQFYKQWLKHGKNYTLEHANDLSPSEGLLNNLGYHNLGNQKYDESIFLFKLAIQLYPNSSNPYDSYAEALEQIDKLEESLEMYQMAFTIANKNNEPAIIHTLVENGITHGYSGNQDASFKLSKEEFTDKIIYRLFNDSHSNCQVEKSTTGTGLRYVEARLEACYPNNWKLNSHKVDNGWEVIIKISAS